MIKGFITLKSEHCGTTNFEVEGKNPKEFEMARIALTKSLSKSGYYLEVPVGGFSFPASNLPTFDFSAIGARFGKLTEDGNEVLGLWHGGHFYKLRVMAKTEKTKKSGALPLKIKFSRGAKSTDPEHTREKTDGAFEYVTLIQFVERFNDYKADNYDVGPDTTPLALMFPEIVEAMNLRPAAQAKLPTDPNWQKGYATILELYRSSNRYTGSDTQVAAKVEEEAASLMGGDVILAKMDVNQLRDVYKALLGKYKAA